MTAFDINFGNAKPLILPEDGMYELVVEDYMLKEAKKEESRAKGFNIALTFRYADEEIAKSAGKVFHNLWFHYENPWAAKQFFEALTGQEMNEETDPEFIQDKDNFIGVTVGAGLARVEYESNGKTREKMEVIDGSWYQV